MPASPPPPGLLGTPPQRSRTGALTIRALWALLTIASFGMAAWVPSLVFAIRRRTRGAVIWLAVFVTALFGFITLLIFVPSSDEAGGGGPAQFLAGAYSIMYIVGATVHAWIASAGPTNQRPPLMRHPGYVQHPQVGWVPHQGQRPLPGYSPGAVWPSPTMVQPPHPYPPLENTAAEVQAELRELRGLLDKGTA